MGRRDNACNRFMEATVFIGEGDYKGAAKQLRAAICALGNCDDDLLQALTKLLASVEARA